LKLEESNASRTYAKTNYAHNNHRDQVEPCNFEPLAKRWSSGHVHDERFLAGTSASTIASTESAEQAWFLLSWRNRAVTLTAREDTHFDVVVEVIKDQQKREERKMN
jgi:hypothetical protein